MHKNHHGSTHPAWKMLPREESISHWKRFFLKECGELLGGLKSHHINNKPAKRKHTRKSRRWLKRELQKDVDIFYEE